MDRARAILESFPPAHAIPISLMQLDAAIKHYVSELGQLPQNARAAVAAKPAVLLQALDPAKNSIGCLTVLDILHSENPSKHSAEVLDQVVEFLLRFDACQVRYVGAAFLSLLERVGSGNLFPPLVAVELLATAIQRLDPSGFMYTSTHLVMAKLAYASNSVEPALRVLDSDILFYPLSLSGSKETRLLCDPDLAPSEFISSNTGLSDQLKTAAVLEYNILRGLIYISRRDWSKARSALDQVITHPSRDRGVSKMMTDAHKKWVLVGLLEQGKAPVLPSYTNSAAQINYQSMNKPYLTFAGLFSTDKVAEIRRELETNRQTWEDDGNASLIAEAMTAYQKWQIINLQQIYARLSISDVRQATLNADSGEPLSDDDATLAVVREMIESGMLNGEIQTGQGDGQSYLAFQGTESLISEAEFATAMARSHHVIESLSRQYRLTSERLNGHKEYVRHLVREQKRAEVDKEADAAVGFESQVEDEDLMTGVLAHA